MSLISKFVVPSIESAIAGVNKAIANLDAVTEAHLANIKRASEAIAQANASIEVSEGQVVRSVRIAEKLRELVA